MDPYARVRIAHAIYETHANSSGGKTPRWNKRVQWYYHQNISLIVTYSNQKKIEILVFCLLV